MKELLIFHLLTTYQNREITGQLTTIFICGYKAKFTCS